MRLHAPNAGAQVLSLVRELEPTCYNEKILHVTANKYFLKNKKWAKDSSRSPKKLYTWPIDMKKDARHHEPLGKCKSTPQ